MTTRRFVIIGGGLAAATAAETLRDEGFDGDIMVIGAERHVPYLRPPLSKEYLNNPAKEPAETYVHPWDWYHEHDVHVLTGTLAVELDLVDNRVILDETSSVGFEKALIATGAKPRTLQLPGADAAGVYYLRTLDDSEELREALRQGGRKVVVLGTGWVGMETAAAARNYGNDVTVIGRGAVPLSGGVGPELGAIYGQLHRDHGVQFKLQRGVRALVVAETGGGPAVTGVATDNDGEVIPADIVIVGYGAAPNTEIAEDAGLDVKDGVLASAALVTSNPLVYAAGDVANAVHPVLGRRLRSEHWANAIGGGRTAAKSMLGQDVVYDDVPYFYSDQYDVGMEYAGYVPLAADTQPVFRGDVAAREFIAFWVSGGRLVAGMNVNVWDVSDDIQELIRSGRAVDLAKLTDPNVPILEA
ncbi:NAD(P)/FAD-dependent oxidoreductase [Gryllotalpicola protaetiae]|uniref:NAD(P)/FAD-dependent oxidoreductase n=1 Tax=Gryllotalpicola protaetiae TaxID=2419771 RepID=A0A387BKV1_9MICO|nr:FAD-dependent oxidoreductase [Gryllotalpicola protaetiae]AYG02794.1 NAD(P)/FAD-dependent oxidoreductase [Gryllotalpicola protaetiae]